MAACCAQAWYNTSPMKDLLEKASHIPLLIPDIDGALTDGGLELHSRVRGTIDDSDDDNG